MLNMYMYPVLKQYHSIEEGSDVLRIPMNDIRSSISNALVSLLSSCSTYALVKRDGDLLKVVL